jgi:hypothetical protein
MLMREWDSNIRRHALWHRGPSFQYRQYGPKYGPISFWWVTLSGGRN